jgi:lambda repressor-like predicted transcriptional regulator
MKRRSKQQVEALAIEAANMYASDMPPSAIASELDISIPYLYKLLGEQGVELNGGTRESVVDSLPDEVKEEIIRVYQTREISLSAMLAEYGLSYNQMYTLLRKENVEIRKFIADTEESRQKRMDLAVQMYLDGAKLWLIEDETGIHQPQLHAELHKRGVELRRARPAMSKRKKTGMSRLDKVTDDPLP